MTPQRQSSSIPGPSTDARDREQPLRPPSTREPAPREAAPRDAAAPAGPTANDDHRAAEKILPLLQSKPEQASTTTAVLLAFAWLVAGTAICWSIGIADLPIYKAAVLALAILVVPPAAIVLVVRMAAKLNEIRRALGSLTQVVIGLADARPKTPEIAPHAIAAIARDVLTMNDAIEQVARRVKSFETSLSAELLRAEQAVDSQKAKLELAISALDTTMRVTSGAIDERLAQFDARLAAGFGQSLGALDTRVDEALRTIETTMTEGSRGAVDAIRLEVAAIEDGLRGDLFRFAEEVDHLGNGLTARVSSESSRLLGTISQATNDTSARLSDCMAGIKGQTVEFHALLGTIIEEASGAVAETAQQAATLASSTFVDASANLEKSMSDRVEKLGEACQAVVDAVTEQVVVIEGALRDEVARVSAVTTGIGEELAARISQETAQGARLIAEAAETSAGRLAENLVTIEEGAAKLEKAGTALDGIARQVSSSMDEVTAKITATLDHASGELSTTVVDSVTRVWHGYEETLDQALTSLTEALDESVRKKLHEQEAGFVEEAGRLVGIIRSELGSQLEKAAADFANDTAGGVRTSLESFITRLEAGLAGRVDDLAASLGGRMMEVADVLDGSTKTIEGALDRLGSTEVIEVATRDFAARAETSAEVVKASVAEAVRALEEALADDRLRAGILEKVERTANEITRRGEETAEVLGNCLDDIEKRLDARRLADELRVAVAETCDEASLRASEIVRAAVVHEAEVFASARAASAATDALVFADAEPIAVRARGGMVEERDRRRRMSAERQSAAGGSGGRLGGRTPDDVVSEAPVRAASLRSASRAGSPRGDEMDTMSDSWPKTSGTSQGASQGASNVTALSPDDFVQSIRQVIGEVLDEPAVEALWASGLQGRTLEFGAHLYTSKGRQLFDQITRVSRADDSFRAAIEKFIDRFETRVRDVARLDRSGSLEKAELLSEAGKTYTLLAHVAETW